MKIINSRIRKSAKGEVCALRLSGCNHDTETTVYAHAPTVDKGMGIKSPDWFGAYACSNCHDAVDGRAGADKQKQSQYRWLPAVYETQKKLIAKGILKWP